ncbi:sigma-70 family RNA polymerase sigma factor [Roseovarius indicus]|uniref:sigma-70 family RNA polymerase sigma factor n=1 Tax=Roseovarius indicus TaxID=540747 RepID=UPI004059D7E2
MSKKDLKDRQVALYRRYQESGDRRAHAELVETFRGLVYQLATRMLPSGIPRDDLVSEGLLGVCEAIEKFEPDRGDMMGIVYRLVQNRLDTLSRDMSRPVSAARSRPERRLRWHLSRKVQEYEAKGYGSTRALELAAHDFGVSVDHAASNLAMRTAVPFDTGDDEDESRQFTDDAPPVEDALDVLRVRKVLAEAMESLDDRERYILQVRLAEDRPSLDSLGAKFGVSRNRIGQIQKDALEHIRFELKRRGLELADLI